MPGIVNQGIQQPAQQEAPVQEQAQAQPSGEEQPTPEEQDAFDRVEHAAMELLYSDEGHEKIMTQLKGGAEQPAQTIAQVAMSIFAKIDKDSNGKIPVTVMMRGAENVLNQVIDLVEKTGVFPIDENVAAQSLQAMVMMAGEQYDIDPQEMQAMIQEMDPAQAQQMVDEQQQIAGAANA